METNYNSAAPTLKTTGTNTMSIQSAAIPAAAAQSTVTRGDAARTLSASGLECWTVAQVHELLDYRLASQQIDGGRSIWLGCLSAYNSGRLHGVWMYTGGICADEMALLEAYVRVTSPMADSEELEIMDQIDYPGFVSDVFEVIDFEETVSAHASTWEVDAYAALCDDQHQVVDWGYFEDLFIQEGECDAEFIEEWYAAAGYETPDHLLGYVDWDAMASDRLLDTFTQIDYQGASYIFHMG